MKKYLVLVCFLVVGASSFAQADQYSKDVKKCIRSNGTLLYYENVVDQMFGELEKRFVDKNVPADVWANLKKIKPTTIDELSQMIVSAYKAHFTHQDVENMNKFYTTKAGKNMFKPELLSEGDKVVLKEFYQSDTGQKIVSSQDSMNDSLGSITEMWSGNLYKSVLDKLSEKGYNL